MRKIGVCLAMVCLFTGAVFADGDGVSTSPLKIWSTGIGGGGIYPLNDSFNGGQPFGKVVWLNSFDFNVVDGLALFADISWYIAENSLTNFGGDVGVDYRFIPDSRVIPFLGLGVGGQYFYKDEDKAAGVEGGGTFGLSLTARVGVALALTKTTDVIVRVPFNYIVNDNNDMGVGAEVGVMFYSRFRGVKQLDY